MQSFEAYRLASRLHAGQVDKAGRPYIEHLARVFVRVQALGGDSIQQIAALLHDAIEDGRATAEQLKWAGVPTAAVDLVVVLSKKKEVRIPLMADSDSIPIADSIPCDGGHAARVS